MHENPNIAQNYSTRPEVVQAMPVLSTNAKIVASWCGGTVVTEIDALDHEKQYLGVNVPTLNGMGLRAQESDYIVRGPDGTFTVYHERMFRAKFQPVR